MMPPIPAVIHLPTEIRNGYYPASVVAAIPIAFHGQEHGSMYAVTAIEPTSSPAAPAFLVAEAGRGIHGFWFADEFCPHDTLAGALARMCDLAGRPGCPSGI